MYAQSPDEPRSLARLKALASQRGVPVVLSKRETIETMAQGRSHGGVVARVRSRRYSTMYELMQSRGNPFLVMIDGVEDPYNFGQSVRSLHAAGSSGLLVRQRVWTGALNIVTRASAGATELLPTAIVSSSVEAARECLSNGISVFALSQKGAESLYSVDLNVPLLLIIGGEKRGIVRSLQGLDVRFIHVPYGRDDSHSLGTAASVSIAAFEVMRQRTAGDQSKHYTSSAASTEATMAHGRDKPKKEVRRPKKAKAAKHPAAARGQQVIENVSGKDAHQGSGGSEGDAG